MKDFYDLWKLSRDFDFDGELLCKAIKATFKRRGTEVPSGTPLALTEEFSRDVQKAKQWQAFVRKSNLDHDGVILEIVAADLTQFLVPLLQAIGTSQEFAMAWRNGGPWSPTTPHIYGSGPSGYRRLLCDQAPAARTSLSWPVALLPSN
jgi:hypothetical protein